MPTNLFKPTLTITTGYLNTVNDPTPGAFSPSYTGENRYAGLLGGIAVYGADEVPYDSSIGVLYGGAYMYVQVAPGAANTVARGKAAFFLASDLGTSNFIITPDPQPGANPAAFLAGVFLSTITKGNYGFIQIGGRVSVLFDSAITSTGAAGNLVLTKTNAAVNGTFDSVEAATINALQFGGIVGPAVEAPAVSVISTALMPLKISRM